MLMAGITLYSSSPPAAIWFGPSSHASPPTASDVDVYSRVAHQSAAARPVVGGLSGLFASGSRSSSTASDGIDSSFTPGMSRSSSMDNLSQFGAWDCVDGRGGSFSVPNGSSFRLKDRSPVSVLHGPAARSGGLTSMASWDAAANAPGLPPLDPHLDRSHPRRKTVLHADKARHPVARSVGFEVGSQSLVQSSDDSSVSSSNSMSPDVGSEALDRYLLDNDGFLRPPLPSEALLSKIKDADASALQEARKRFTRLAQGTHGAPATSRTSNLPLSADELLVDAQERHSIFSEELVVKAFEVAEKAHRGQVRRSGGLYLAHCVETAILVANTGADSAVVAAGLLHDSLDDSLLDRAELRSLLGGEVEYLVSGVSKLSEFSQLARDNETAGNPEEADRLQTMFLAMADVRVVLIKLADRLHNLRTLDALPIAKRLRIAKETMEILVPLANRLGIWSWKAEMEDICFRHLKTREYGEVATKITEGWQKGAVVNSIQQLEWALRREGVEFTDVSGRPKNLYSIYSKMIRKGRTIDEIFDVRGLRLIVKDTESCYAALEVVHRLWSHSPKKFKDYIARPKSNGYRSLHTVIWGEDGRPMEVQIRTMDMHHQAEYGMAAHWRYKENDSEHSSFVLQKVEWARWVLTWHSEILDTKLRASAPEADLRPPCPFPFHEDNCLYADGCSVPPQNESDPLFIIMLKDQNMVVQELGPGATAADLLLESSSDRFSISAFGKRRSCNVKRLKVNHQFVEDYHQKLKMGDLVELVLEPKSTPPMVPLSKRVLALTQAQIDSLSSSRVPGGEIALEFQREQLKRLYLDGGCKEGSERGLPSPHDKNFSVAAP